MAQEASKVLAELKKSVFHPIYFLQGEESYYIDKISDYIEEHALEDAQKGFNQVVLYGKDVDVKTVLANAKRFPMMSDRQVVIVKEAQEIKDLNKEEGSKALVDYIKNPLPSTILVFAHKNKVLDGRKGLSKEVNKSAILVNSKKLYENQVPDWINTFLKDEGFTISPKAKAMLIESVGTSLANLSNEINKVLINCDKGTEINDDLVAKYIGVSKEYNVFELQKALGLRDVLKSNKIISYFEKDPKGNPVIPIIAMLFSYFSKLLLVHHSRDKSDQALASLLKVNPYFVRDYKSAATNYNLVSTVRAVSFLHEADLRSKGIVGGSMDNKDILKELVFKILHS